jgi:PAS domain S-box-containing protein
LNYANQRWHEYTGLSLEEARGMGWMQAVHSDDAAKCSDSWKLAIEAGEVYEMECRLRRASDGAYRWHVCRAVPEFDAGHQLFAWLGTFTDFEDLKQAIHARDEFISIASHELRTPLMALKLPLETILFEGKLTGKFEQRIRSAIRQAELLEKLVDNLLDVSRIASARLELQPEPVDLTELTLEVVERLRAEANRSGSEIGLVSQSSVIGTWDRMRMEQVVTNLLSNAIKYGNGNPISVRIEDSDAQAKLAVQDQGIGIAESDLERIFGRFERATTRRNRRGLGMGLYIASQIVREHGGCITVKSRLGEGTTFTISVPKHTAESTPSQG